MFASLVGPLLGVYYPLPFDGEVKNRLALNSSKLHKLWACVYTEKEVDEQVTRWGGVKLPDEFRLRLDYDSYIVEKGGPQ